jgi:small subunit ribosomal protein S13
MADEKLPNNQKEERPKQKVQGRDRDQKQQHATSIIRIGGRDINGELGIERALLHIKGISHDMSHAVSYAIQQKFGIEKNATLGSLSENQIESIESVIKDPVKYGIPAFMLNRRKDAETGMDIHLIGNDLQFSTRQDVSRDIAIRDWRGYRHQHGQKVRGQRTRSTGRTGATVGVMKKAAKQQLAAAAQEKGKEAAAPAKK